MRTIDTLGDAERGSVWRCPACTVAFIDGAWCRLDYHQWIPLGARSIRLRTPTSATTETACSATTKRGIVTTGVMANVDPDQLPDSAIVTPEAFPGGLCCGGCDCSIDDGQPYCSIPDWVKRDGDMVGLLVCAACALVPR